MMKIFCDSREPIQIFTKLDKLKETYEFDYEKKMLEIGDFLYLDGSVCIERKTTLDFYSSIINNAHIFRQALNMRENFTNPVLLISGTVKECFIRLPKFNINVYRGALASLITKYRLTVVTVPTDIELLHLVLRICKKSTEPFSSALSKIKITDKDVYTNMLGSIPMVGYKKARDILKVYHFESLRELAEKDLTSISGIGPKTAGAIKRFL